MWKYIDCNNVEESKKFARKSCVETLTIICLYFAMSSFFVHSLISFRLVLLTLFLLANVYPSHMQKMLKRWTGLKLWILYRNISNSRSPVSWIKPFFSLRLDFQKIYSTLCWKIKFWKSMSNGMRNIFCEIMLQRLLRNVWWGHDCKAFELVSSWITHSSYNRQQQTEVVNRKWLCAYGQLACPTLKVICNRACGLWSFLIKTKTLIKN